MFVCFLGYFGGKQAIGDKYMLEWQEYSYLDRFSAFLAAHLQLLLLLVMPMAPVGARRGTDAHHFELVNGVEMVKTRAHLHGNQFAQVPVQEAEQEEAVLAQHLVAKLLNAFGV